jgi:murein DD-endopeptidase MepM/ murein hydrolase activator NlpD
VKEHSALNLFWRAARKTYVLFLLLLLAACLPAQDTPVPTARRPAVTPISPAQLPVAPTTEPQPQAAVSVSPSPTAVIAVQVEEEETAEPELPILAAPSAAPDPLRFVFPSPAQAPVSAWRPPLYPTPWAPSPFDHFYFSRPISADDINWPLWDYRYGGSFFANTIHTGIDIPARKGTPVLAAGSGKVIWAGYGLYRGVYDTSDPYGLAVVIQHDFSHQGDRLHTVYAHLSQIDVVRNQIVESGEPVGLTGDTGHVTGPHLHFEVRIGKNDFFTTRNPELWLVPPQGWGVLVGRITNSSGQLVPEQMVSVYARVSREKWMAKSYGSEAVNSDPYYRENLVISDLPAGQYEIRIAYQGTEYTQLIEINPGLVSYFSFRGHTGFSLEPPPLPGASFTPEAAP